MGKRGIRMIGFLGVEKFDIIFYTARIMRNLNCNVLVMDFADEKSITYSIPNNTHVPVFNYNGIDFISDESAIKLCGMQYDFILIDFGFNVNHKLLARCDEVYFVTNMFINNTSRLLETSLYENQERFLIIRDAYDYKNITSVITAAFSDLCITPDMTFVIPQDEQDLENQFECMYNSVHLVNAMSSEMEQVLILIASKYFIEKDLRAAIKSLARGKR